MSETNDLSQGVIFPIGEKLPLMFSQYFIGQAHLNMLTTKGVAIGNVTFEPGCRNNWHIHHKGDNSCLLLVARDIIRSGRKKQYR